ncbi:MAG TPA: YciI family protein [Mycobacteriales bacterium]|nr:YciI family protein [Mycobacteriales bacterium]
MDLEAFELVILRRPPDARDYDEPTLERIQREHMAYGDSLGQAGRTVAHGPVLDQPDESVRGMAFYRTGSLAEARRLAEQDPAVLAGRLAVEVMTWWCHPGTMRLPGRPVTIPDP